MIFNNNVIWNLSHSEIIIIIMAEIIMIVMLRENYYGL